MDPDAGVVRGVLLAVDCQARRLAQAGYTTLADPGSPLQGWLTSLLIIYVAVLGYRMLFAVGSVRLERLPLIGVAIGVTLTLAVNWPPFETVVFDAAYRGPMEIAKLATAPLHGSTMVADPISTLQAAHDELQASAAALGKAAGPGASAWAGGDAAAAEALWRAAQILVLSTAGVFSAAMVVVAMLSAVGPVFIALALPAATRGLFVGWLRGLAAASLTLAAGWIATSLMLVIIGPALTDLAEARAADRLDTETAMTAATIVFVFAFVQAAATGAAILVAVSVRGPRIAGADLPDREGRTAAPGASPADRWAVSRSEALAAQLRHPHFGSRLGEAAPGGGSSVAAAFDHDAGSPAGAPRSWPGGAAAAAQGPYRRAAARTRASFLAVRK